VVVDAIPCPAGLHTFEFCNSRARFWPGRGDFNNDGIPDLAVTTPFDAGVNIFLGDGTGKFTPMNNPGTGMLPTVAGFIPGSLLDPRRWR
jgi:hypothetical protein